MRGLHELPVCEALWRLCGHGETTVDVGANIGVMTSLLSKRVGAAGRVVAFEAHPELFRQLQMNVQRWPDRRIDCLDSAVSCSAGTLRMFENEWFQVNEGTACIGKNGKGGKWFDLRAVRLDDVLGDNECGVMKIDVEGHEFEALSGAQDVLASGKLRDIVYESSWEYPSRSHEFLEGHGYKVFDLRASFFGLELAEPSRRTAPAQTTTDYLATLDPDRAQTLMLPRGWRVLWGNE
jgi:FkbM family methyltransferase